MIELELEINSGKFRLNDKENNDKLKGSGLKKVGFFTRRLIKSKPGEEIYFAKNCTIELFKSLRNQKGTNKYESEGRVLDEFIFGPSGNRQGYMSGTWGTSVYLHFLDNKLCKVSFQTIHNRIMAQKVIIEFEKRIRSIYGNPECINQDGIRICKWTLENSIAVSELNEKIQNSYIHWMTN